MIQLQRLHMTRGNNLMRSVSHWNKKNQSTVADTFINCSLSKKLKKKPHTFAANEAIFWKWETTLTFISETKPLLCTLVLNSERIVCGFIFNISAGGDGVGLLYQWHRRLEYFESIFMTLKGANPTSFVLTTQICRYISWIWHITRTDHDTYEW